MSTQPVSLHRYSFQWARSIVKRLEEKYPRGTEMLYEILAIQDHDMATYLANGDPLWPHLRNLAQFLQAYWKNPDYRLNLPSMKQDVRHWARKHGDKRILLRLDDLGILDES